jgi:3-deoxy-7-phosphoheptulonate synthase/chorismate mutase
MDTTERDLEALRGEIEAINLELLELLSRRARVVDEIHRLKERQGLPCFLPEREHHMIEELVARNPGPFSDGAIRHLFKEIFEASLAMMERAERVRLRVARAPGRGDVVIDAGGARLGAAPVVIAGPCAVESEPQMMAVAGLLCRLGVKFLRGGAFKPRTSPYAFQGLGREGLELLERAARQHGLASVTEVTDPREVDLVARHADVLQVGARNMYNYALLRELGRCGKPVLLKRGLSATLEEFLLAAEYVALGGNEDIILCERGVRTFERETRFTLDISAVPLLRQASVLPVVVDVSHAAGRRDILAPLSKAALAAGAQGVMVEVHPDPACARSDGHQQLDPAAFERYLVEIGLRPAPG